MENKMKVLTTSKGKRIVKISRQEWVKIGQENNWQKPLSGFYKIDESLKACESEVLSCRKVMNQILSMEEEIIKLAEYIYDDKNIGTNYVVYIIDSSLMKQIEDTDSVGTMFIKLLEVKNSVSKMLEEYRSKAREKVR